MDVERLPSGKFEANELVLELAIIAYNLLRMMGQESLRHKPGPRRKVKRRRIRTVIDITPARKDRKGEGGERNRRHGMDDAVICA